MIKILFVGAGDYPMYESAFYEAATKNTEIQAEIFVWHDELKKINNVLLYKFENKLAIGPHVSKINKKLLSYCNEKKFDIVFFYSCRLIYPNTIRKLKEQGCYVAVYNNDDPFAQYYPRYFWRHYRKSLSFCDIAYVYRTVNISECKECGASRVELLRAYYIKERNYYISDEKNDVEVPDVLFLGHQEKDERQEYIRALLEKNIYVGVPKSVWSDYEVGNPYLIRLEDTQAQYNKMLNKTKVAIVFLSKINRDTYTRRCFEIPVTKTLMVAPYTDDLAQMFEEDKEVVFYRNKEEFLKKICFYLQNENERMRIAYNGYERVLQEGHEAFDRVQKIIDDYKNR